MREGMDTSEVTFIFLLGFCPGRGMGSSLTFLGVEPLLCFFFNF